jgi:hypothetical protein
MLKSEEWNGGRRKKTGTKPREDLRRSSHIVRQRKARGVAEEGEEVEVKQY